jgi:hypothetical protein
LQKEEKAMIRKWIYTDAEWYEFWMPQSGPVGGLILSAILWGIFVAVLVVLNFVVTHV